jgi:hypothetical protein
MAKLKDYSKQNLFTTTDILDEIKKYYDIKDKEYDASIIRKIQRFMKDNKIKVEKSIGRSKYYNWSAVEVLLNDANIIRYCRRIAGKKDTYQTNHMVLQEQKEELDAIQNMIVQLQESVGVTPEEAMILDLDKATDQIYLSVDELKLFNDNKIVKKGLCLKEDLSNDEKEFLNDYQNHLRSEDYTEKKIEQLFHEKKLELMITALFENQGFTLDEALLRTDISIFLRAGKYTATFNSVDLDLKEPSPIERRSFLRLKQGKGYVRKKK